LQWLAFNNYPVLINLSQLDVNTTTFTASYITHKTDVNPIKLSIYIEPYRKMIGLLPNGNETKEIISTRKIVFRK